MDNPLVSIVTITYNHEPWIAKTIEGVLSQKVDFPIEMIIAEDCSTDGTRAICEEYAERYPDVIRLLPSDYNHGIIENELRAIQAARGRYIAFCEGDDFWTEPLKLYNQIHFLEEHTDYNSCFTRCHHKVWSTNEMIEDNGDKYFSTHSGVGVDVDMTMYLHDTVSLMYLTLVYRKSAISDSLMHQFSYWRDTHLFYYLIKNGKCFLFSFFGGVRTIHDDSMTHQHRDDEVLISYKVEQELFLANRDDIELKASYIASLRAAYAYFLNMNKCTSFRISNEIVRVDRKYHRWVMRIVEILRHRAL